MTTLANQMPRINLQTADRCRQIEAKCPDVTLKSGQQNASSLTQDRLTQNRQCTHLSFVQAQHYCVALESRVMRKLNHNSETVRISFLFVKERVEMDINGYSFARPAVAEVRKWQPLCLDSEGHWLFPSPVIGRPYHADSIRTDYLVPSGARHHGDFSTDEAVLLRPSRG